jgi:hypothetical protein
LKAEPGAATFLQHESRSLCGKINAALGRDAVARLRFVQGPLASRSPLRGLPSGPLPALPPDDPAAAYRGPSALQEALIRFARQRQRNRKA